MYLLVVSEILGLFVNTLAADDKYSLPNSENLWQPIEMQLSKKQKKLFLNSLPHSRNLHHHFLYILLKGDDGHSLLIFQITEIPSL